MKNKKKKNGFTLIELIAVLVIMAIIALIVTPLVMSIIRKAKVSARKRSVDAYGRSVELAIASYLLDTGTFPTNEQLPNLKIEYSGSNVVCNVMNMKKNGGLYLSQCKVNNIEVKDSNEEDGYYHYGTRDLTNSETIEMYASSIKSAINDYYDKNNSYPTDISELTLDYTGENISCDVEIYGDGAIYMTKCSISGIEVKDDTEDGYYHYGTKREKLIPLLLSKINDISITNYTDGNTHEMYTFEHPATEQTPALTDYRYIGANPNNYVKFNNEIWRIIGVFTVEDGNGNWEQRIKIIRLTSIGDYAYDSNWNNDYTTATINGYLNGVYYNSFSNDTKEMISETKYYLGGEALGLNGPYGSGSTIYNWEHGSKVYNGHSINWTGNIGLVYPSDYAYTYALGVSDGCYTEMGQCGGSNGYRDTWLYMQRGWFISPRSENLKSVLLIFDSSFATNSECGNGNAIRPTLYLSSDVKTDSGDGSETNPYNLKL